MGAAAALAHVVTPTVRIADVRSRLDLEQIFPRSSSSWHVDHSMPIVLPLPEMQARVDATYNRVLTRTYISNEGYRVMLLAAYGADQAGMGVHLPEACYPAQGFDVTSHDIANLRAADRSLLVRRLVTRRGSRSEPVTYWVVIGDTLANARTQQRMVMMRYAFRGQIPDGMLIRVSSIDHDAERAFQQQALFIDEMVKGIHSTERVAVLGSP
jgi:EpsI family protein